MNVAMLGATGRTGRLIVRELLAAGHDVRALARHPVALGTGDAGLAVLPGDGLDAAAVASLVSGVDAVVSAVGPSRGAPDTCSRVTRNVLAAMRAKGVRRYIFVSGSHVDAPGDDKSLPARIASRVGRLLAPAVVADKQRELALVLDSDIDWTAVRPPALTNGAQTNRYRAGTRSVAGSRIRRADLAVFIVRELGENRYVRSAPFISAD